VIPPGAGPRDPNRTHWSDPNDLPSHVRTTVGPAAANAVVASSGRAESVLITSLWDGLATWAK